MDQCCLGHPLFVVSRQHHVLRDPVNRHCNYVIELPGTKRFGRNRADRHFVSIGVGVGVGVGIGVGIGIGIAITAATATLRAIRLLRVGRAFGIRFARVNRRFRVFGFPGARVRCGRFENVIWQRYGVGHHHAGRNHQPGAFGWREVGGNRGVGRGFPVRGRLEGGQERRHFGHAAERGFEVAAFHGLLVRRVAGEDAKVDTVAQVATFGCAVGEQVLEG